MRVYLPGEGFSISLPDNLPQISPQVSIVHHSMWKEFARDGDVCISDQFEPPEVVNFIMKHKCGAVLQKNSSWFERDLESCIRLHQDQAKYLSDPVNVALAAAQRCMSWEFNKQEQKSELKAKILQEISKGTESLKESVNVVFEELFMNAIIDAPKNSILQKLESFPYEKHRPARLHLGIEPGRLCLACEDPYGTLNVNAFVERMDLVYTQGAGAVVNLKSEKGGAGLGCVLLFERCGSMYIGAKKDEVSTVACVIPTELNHRRKDSIRKSLHLIQL